MTLLQVAEKEMNDAHAELRLATVAAAKMADATAKSQMKTMAFRDSAYAAFSGDADRKRRAPSDDNIQQDTKKKSIPLRLVSRRIRKQWLNLNRMTKSF
jgi:hypothetical protein